MAEERIIQGLHQHIAHLQQEYSLAGFNRLGVGGVADYFTEAENTVELASAVKGAIDLKLPYIVIGQGEGVIFSDSGFPGLVIHNKTSSYGFALDKSQVVVDSGLPLSRFITLAAERGLGGLTHLYAESGTVGGALYANVAQGGWPILSSVRYVTMLMPPARIDKEATINRYKREWLEKEPGETRLQHLKSEPGIDEPQPVILTILFQLTHVRRDELQDRLQQASRNVPDSLMGPIFLTDPEVPLDDLLRGAQVARLRVGNVYPDRYFPNYITARGKARAEDLRTLVLEMQAKVENQYGVSLKNRYEFVGVW